MEEIYLTVPNYPLYKVSNFGNVKSFKFGKEKILKPNVNGRGYLNGRGYYKITVWNNGKSKKYNVHQLVAIVFLNHIPNGLINVVDHIDNNRLNNRLDNLRIVSQKENIYNYYRLYFSKMEKSEFFI